MTEPGRASDVHQPAGSRSGAAPWLWWAFVAAVIGHLLALYWPRVDLGGVPGGRDKLLHVLIFLVPTAVGLVVGRHFWAVVGVMAAHAPLSELIQDMFLAGRSGDPLDAVADLVGVVLAAAGVGLWRRWRG